MKQHEMKKRLDHIEGSLTPRQAVLLAIKQLIARFESPSDGDAWLADHPDEHWLGDLRNVLAVFTGRLKKEPREVVLNELAGVLAERISLAYLWLLCNQYVASVTKQALPSLADLAEKNCLAMEQLESRRAAVEGDRAALAEGEPDMSYGQEITQLLQSLLEARSAISTISNQYFDDHQLLFPKHAKQLDEEIEEAQVLARNYNGLVQIAQPPGVGAAGAGQSITIDIDQIEQAANARVVSLVRDAVAQGSAATEARKRAEEILSPFLTELKARIAAEKAKDPRQFGKPVSKWGLL